ncbi:MAG TPA: S8 family serine peptidase [Thermoanaerobaculia bacterium]|nr:S8 family serine peptidase [Thermoanaerobaculia bacterium]
MRKLFAVLLVAATASANEVSYRSLQTGSPTGGTPLYDAGIHGEGQIVAVLDTGLDYTSCYFAEADGSRPPINTGTASGGFAWQNVDTSRRKVIAYDFLYSCDQFPNASGCDDPSKGLGAFDNQGHGTHAAASIAADRDRIGEHDFADAIAPMAKLVIQDGGFTGGDNCSQRPGFGCPVQILPILDQAYKQGARIHSNSWGDRQGVRSTQPSPTANYSQSARDVDAFIYSHPDMLIVFNTGNWGGTTAPPQSTLSAPGCAKNTLQIGGTRDTTPDDDVIASYTLFGPTRDGRIKPDLVGPSMVTAGDIDVDENPNTCDVSRQQGTSWSSPSIAGAAALVRQYYTDGFYPNGAKNAGTAMTPSAALMKATLIAAARPAHWRGENRTKVPALPVPSYEQGWGFPVLDDALYLAGDTRKLRVEDVALANGLAEGESRTIRINARVNTPLKVVLVWTDPAGVVRGTNDSTPELVNDLDLRVKSPDGTTLGNADHLNNVEVVSLEQPSTGGYDITISAQRIGQGPRQSYALVVTGDLQAAPAPAASKGRAVRH